MTGCLDKGRGWIHTNAGAHQHLFTRICSWLPPYHVGVERLNFEQHEVPTLFSAALSRGGHGAKRRRLSPSSLTASSHQTSQAPAEPEGANNWMPASLDWMGMELSSKTPVNILNELGPKVFRCYPEFVTTTQEDAVNPYLTTVVMEGIVVARGGFTNKKMSRQLAARTALGVLCPLLQLAPDAVAGGPIFPGEEAASGMLGARRVTVAELEAKEVATLRLKLTDDKILESTVGKTPVMVLQEHCHKHVGRVPTYTDVTEAAAGQRAPRASSVRSGPQSFTVNASTGPISVAGTDTTKKRAKQRAALAVLRLLYPHVVLWGDLVESMNSRQREARVEGERKRRREPPVCEGEGVGGAGSRTPPQLLSSIGVALRMVLMVKEQLWQRVAERRTVALDVIPLARQQ